MVLATTALVAVSLGSALGRWRVLPVMATGSQVHLDDGSLAVVVPVPVKAVRAGDLIFFVGAGDTGSIRKVVRINDSWKHEVLVDRRGKGTQNAQLPATVGRVSRVLPYGGWVFRLLVGPIQAVLMMVGGLLMVVMSQFRRPPVQAPADPSSSSGPAPRRFRMPRRGPAPSDPVVANLPVAQAVAAVEPTAGVIPNVSSVEPPVHVASAPPGWFERAWPIGVGLGTALALVLYVSA